MKLRLVSTLAVAALMLAAVALPAAADHAGVGIFTGSASVGRTFDDPATAAPAVESCGNNGIPTGYDEASENPGVYGDGLLIPDPNNLGGIDGVWFLSTSVTGAPLDGSLNICGELTENELEVGASCGMSHGYDGRGEFITDAGVVALSDISWRTSAGGTLPTTGSYTTADGHTGTLLALTQAQGGQGCIDDDSDVDGEDGARTFSVVGVTSMVPNA